MSSAAVTRRSISAVISIAVLVIALVAAGLPVRSQAASFDPGYIISDEQFFNSASMTEAQIDAFLLQKVPICQSGYICLRDWRDTSTNRSADAMCSAYNGAPSERAATIIYRVSQACGINPQVILATLQKEQGLVTHTWPSDWRYKIAMGQGCPDTAECDSTYYGFFNQVYGAAWQFKRYANPPGTSRYFTWYAPGNTWNILWNPNTGCGSAPVYIRNQATADLYYYTPYQPNQAALNNLYGEGDGCSSYGNRNFWRWFNEWFGDSTANGVAAIDNVAARWGSQLGAATSGYIAITGNGSGTGKVFQNGSVYWKLSNGAFPVLNPVRELYWSLNGSGGPLAWPTSDPITLTGPEGGMAQAFERGSVYSSPATGSHTVQAPVISGYFALSGGAGPLGLPTAEAKQLTGGVTQDFQRGIVAASAAGSFGVFGDIGTYHQAKGGVPKGLGWPLSAYAAYGGGGGGQLFQNGSVYVSGAGTYMVSGSVRNQFWTTGAAALGWPAAEQSCASGTCQQLFQNGIVAVNDAQKLSAAVPGPVGIYYAGKGGATSALGWPSSGYAAYGAGAGGQMFQNGSVYTSSAGTFTVGGNIRSQYWGTGSAILGWPTAEQMCNAGVCQQAFQNGIISTDDSRGLSVAVSGPVGIYFSAKGGVTSSLGWPTSGYAAYAVSGGGGGQMFQDGSVYTSAAGTYTVTGGIRTQYWATGIATLGWPTAEQTCSNGSCRQTFQRGTLIAAG